MKEGRIRETLLGASGFLVVLFLAASVVSACTCGELTVAQQKENATTVFLGTVISKEKSDAVEPNGVKVKLRPEMIWKGQLQKTVAVYTGATEPLYSFVNLCASPFKVGRKYVVFTYGKDKLVTDVCMGTTGFPYAKEVIRSLGRALPHVKSMKTPSVKITTCPRARRLLKEESTPFDQVAFSPTVIDRSREAAKEMRE